MLVDVSYYDYLSSELQNVLNDDIQIEYQRFLGQDCNPNNVKEYLDELSCIGDIVFFVYTGHGGRSHKDVSKFPRMCLGSHYADEWISVSNVIDVIRSKGARLQIVIADCCNSYYDRPVKQNVEGFINLPRGFSQDVLRRLFYDTEGEVCITAASPGEYGWCNSREGSFLSYYFVSTLQNAHDDITWQVLFQAVSDKTFEITDKMYRNRSITKSQRPVFDVSVSPRDNNDDNNGGYSSIIVDNNDAVNNNDWNRDDNDDNRYGGDSSYNVIDNREDYIGHNNSSVNIFSLLFFLCLGYILLTKFQDAFRKYTLLLLIIRLLGMYFIIKSFLILIDFLR
ncbi:MAG: caspase family protein [Bacteroidaceae bacterium]|nr:caspase family protein [Bacteroidaceae bacterium]